MGLQALFPVPTPHKEGKKMETNKVNIQIARLLNESSEYKCSFTASGDNIWATITDGPDTPSSALHSWVINPAAYLESVEAKSYTYRRVFV